MQFAANSKRNYVKFFRALARYSATNNIYNYSLELDHLC